MGPVEPTGQPPGEDKSTDGDVLTTYLKALADRHSRMILLSATERAKTIEEICREARIPLSSGYRKANALARCGLLVVESIDIAGGGKRRSSYRGTFATVKIDISGEKLSIEATMNPVVKAKIAHRRTVMTEDRRPQ